MFDKINIFQPDSKIHFNHTPSMIKTICILGILLCFSGLVSAQERADTIRIEKRQVSRFYYQDFRLKHAQMVLLTKPNPEAYKEMLKAKRKYGTANF